VLGLIPVIPRRGDGGHQKVPLLPLRRKQIGGPAVNSGQGPEAAFASDAYERLHANLLFVNPGSEPKTLLVTSPLSGDGKTTTATNLAVTLAQRGLRVLLIDADLRRGLVHRVTEKPRGVGLTEVLASSATVEEARLTIDVGTGVPVHVLTAGSTPPNPAQLLGSPRMEELVRSLSRDYDRIIMDSSPVNLVADAMILAPLADAILLVARAGVTPFDALTHAVEQFRIINRSVTGSVLNDIDFMRDASYDPTYRWSAYGKYYSAATSSYSFGR
jgi:polysaccharide biosynthesis transport protein